jgi:hypothetical protein
MLKKKKKKNRVPTTLLKPPPGLGFVLGGGTRVPSREDSATPYSFAVAAAIALTPATMPSLYLSSLK